MICASKIARIVSFTLIVFSSACVLGPSDTSTPRTYFLNPEISWKNPHGYGERLGTAVLLITQPKAQAGFDTARMAYLVRPYEINYFAFNQWADTPARLLHRIMVENLDKIGLWSAVLQTPGTVPAQYRLDCDNLILEQQFFSRPSRVRLSVRAQIIETKKPAILATRYFEVLEVAPTDDAYGGVQAGNHAAEKLLIELAAWLDAVMKETQ
ncbi:MAG: putative ABC-type transport system, auxiliary component [Deltaproteobacteria bacterium]|nr:putative ABC-type transport system, auxiliary component [Deltaproteobacteria bacterium]